MIEMGGSASGPLAGVRVIDLTINILGPVAAQILGDMGADVIKVEAPAGDQNRHAGPMRTEGMGVLFLNANRNKRSVVLDLKQPAALQALLELVDTADVFIHSMRPQAAERLGVGPAALRARNPRLIYAYGPGYRGDGPKRDLPAFDDVIQGESGLTGLTQLQQGTPNFLPMVIADKFCGHVLASAVGMALFQRERSGQGQVVEVPMLETMLSFNLIEHLWGATHDQPRGDIGFPRPYMPERRPYRTADGHLCVMASSDEQWWRLLEAVGLPELAADPRYRHLTQRSMRYPELYAQIGRQLAQQSNAHWCAVFERIDLPHAPSRPLNELLDDPYLQQTGFFAHYQHPTEGALTTPSVPVRFSQTPGNIRRPPPKLGEHTEEVLSELGFSAAEIAAVRAARL